MAGAGKSGNGSGRRRRTTAKPGEASRGPTPGPSDGVARSWAHPSFGEKRGEPPRVPPEGTAAGTARTRPGTICVEVRIQIIEVAFKNRTWKNQKSGRTTFQ